MDYSIAQLANEFGVTTRTLRFYEAKGLLAPQRTGSRRRFSERDRTRLRLALRGKRLGFTLEECREIIDMYDSSQVGSETQLTALLSKISQHRNELLRKLADIQATLEAMEEVESQCLASLRRRSGS